MMCALNKRGGAANAENAENDERIGLQGNCEKECGGDRAQNERLQQTIGENPAATSTDAPERVQQYPLPALYGGRGELCDGNANGRSQDTLLPSRRTVGVISQIGG
jgi:hypothetical protein